MIIIDLKELEQAAETRPAGYFNDVLAHAEKITEHYIELSVDNYDKLCQKYRADHVSIYDQIRQSMRAQIAQEDVDKNAPGEVLIRFVRQLGFNVSPDCPCRKKIAIINARGVDWAYANHEQIADWFIETAAQWAVDAPRSFVENLIQRSCAFSRRHEKPQTQFRVNSEENG